MSLPRFLTAAAMTIGHSGSRQPPKSSLPEKDPKSPRQAGYRIPRFIADLAAANPIIWRCGSRGNHHRGGIAQAQRHPVRQPRLMMAGTNCVTTDAVGMAVMGFDPMADRGTAPFETCDNTVRLAEELGVGTRDLKRIEVIGVPIKEAVFGFREHGAREMRWVAGAGAPESDTPRPRWHCGSGGPCAFPRTSSLILWPTRRSRCRGTSRLPSCRASGGH